MTPAADPLSSTTPNTAQPPPPTTPSVPIPTAAIDHCRNVTKLRAKNFYYGMRLMPEPRRSAMYAVYAFMRACDDLADEPETSSPSPVPSPPLAVTLEHIQAFRAQMQHTIDSPTPPPSDPTWAAFNWVAHAYPINPADLHGMLDGQCNDLTKNRYQSFDELYHYCYQVASTVGLVCLSVWGADQNPQARKYAEYRGIALQLTNIIRDLVEDAQRDRLYLPIDELHRFDIDPQHFLQQLRTGIPTEDFDRFMKFQLRRAKRYYRLSADLESFLEPSCRPACWAIMRIYQRLLEKIAANPRRVLRERVRLGTMAKIAIGAKAVVKNIRHH